jgi:uncharacterized repeat protein (TIGR01451 family)
MKWIAGAVVILLLALAFRLGLLAYAMYALLAVIFVSRYLTKRWVEALHAVRELNRSEAEVGDTVAVVIQLENRGPLPIPWILVEDLLPREAIIYEPPKLAVLGRRIALIMLWPRAKQSLLYQFRCNRRGYFQIGPLVLETGDLFGLHRRYKVAQTPQFLLVRPKVTPLLGYEISSRRPIGEVRMTYRLFEDPTRISGVRKYEPGDPLNRVNWRATARTGALHSKVYEPSTVAGSTILLDFHTASYDQRYEPNRSELAISAAASIANAIYLLGQQVGLVTNARDAADRIRYEGWASDHRSRAAARASAEPRASSDRLRPLVVETRRGADQLQRILETLARAELTDGLTLPELVLECASRLPRDATVIAIVPRMTPEDALALGTLRRRGLAVTAILNMFDDYEFAQQSGLLLAEGVETRFLRNEAALSDICNRQALPEFLVRV